MLPDLSEDYRAPVKHPARPLIGDKKNRDPRFVVSISHHDRLLAMGVDEIPCRLFVGELPGHGAGVIFAVYPVRVLHVADGVIQYPSVDSVDLGRCYEPMGARPAVYSDFTKGPRNIPQDKRRSPEDGQQHTVVAQTQVAESAPEQNEELFFAQHGREYTPRLIARHSLLRSKICDQERTIDDP
jgi:hypothetical protein